MYRAMYSSILRLSTVATPILAREHQRISPSFAQRAFSIGKVISVKRISLKKLCVGKVYGALSGVRISIRISYTSAQVYKVVIQRCMIFALIELKKDIRMQLLEQEIAFFVMKPFDNSRKIPSTDPNVGLY